MPETTPKIYSALANVMQDVDHVSKRDRNEHQNFMFRGIDAVVNAVGPALRKHKVIVVPDIESVTYAAVTTSTNKPANACRVVVAYIFTAVDGSSITVKVAGEAWDHGDKATPKAMSVAFRTALLQALALPTDDPDPDASSYQGQVREKDWGAVVDTAASLTDVDALRQLWVSEGVGKAPRAVQEAVKARVQAAEAWTATPEDEAAVAEAKKATK